MSSILSPSRIAGDTHQEFSSLQSSYVSTNSHNVLDPEELINRLRYERSNAPCHSLSGQISSRRARSPSQDEMTANYEACAKRDHDLLIEMGGRPTCPVRLKPIWTAQYKDGLIYIIDIKGELDYTLSDDIDPMYHHWQKESGHFRRELENWKKFREGQLRYQHLDRPETQLELDSKDAGLIKILTRLSDWQEFEVFQDLICVDAAYFEDRCRMNLLAILKCQVATEHSSTSSAGHNAIGHWFRTFDQSQEEVEAAEDRLKWIQGEWPKVIAESVALLSKTPELRQALIAKFRKQTYGVFSAIQKLGGRPSHAVCPPDENMDDLNRVLYWNLETSKYKEELLEWKKFIKWRERHLGEISTIQGQEYQCPQFQSTVEFYSDFERFRSYEHDVALSWLKVWQRVARWYEEEMKTPRWYVDETNSDFESVFLDDYAEAARSQMRNWEQKIADTAIRLEKSRKEHARALSEHGKSSGGETRVGCPQEPFPPTRPLSGSESLQSSQSSSSSTSQIPLFTPSPQSSLSSKSSQSPRSLQYSQSPERLSKDQKPSSKTSSAAKKHRRSKKEAARKEETMISNINTKQQALPELCMISHRLEDDNNVHMTDVPMDLTSVENEEQSQRTGDEDTIMTGFEYPLNHISSFSSQPPSENITNINSKKLPSPSAQGSIPRKTRSATKLDQALSSRVLKTTNKKPAKKTKAFTEKQTMMLLNTAASNTSPPDGQSLRRSERLKEKAAASAIVAAPQLYAAQSSPPLGQMQTQNGSNLVQTSRPSRQKKPKIQPPTLEASQRSRRSGEKKQRCN